MLETKRGAIKTKIMSQGKVKYKLGKINGMINTIFSEYNFGLPY
jgi:hypothetical protein